VDWPAGYYGPGLTQYTPGGSGPCGMAVDDGVEYPATTLDVLNSFLDVQDIDGSGVPRILFSRYSPVGSLTLTGPCHDDVVYAVTVTPGSSPSLGAPPADAYPGLLQTVTTLGGAQQTINYQSLASLGNVGTAIPTGGTWVVTGIQSTNGIDPSSQMSRT